MTKIVKCVVAFSVLMFATVVLADTAVRMNFTKKHGIGKTAGTVTIIETKYGLLFVPNLHNVTPGIHGFHVHVNPSCDKDGMAAGDHFDPNHTGKHLGPYNDKGHLGDLPAVYATSEDTITLPVLAPRLHHISSIKNHALMIHEDGDNYSDIPAKLGGGGGRMICGVIR